MIENGAGAPSDVERRLIAALEEGLAPVVADAAALRVGARAGSRRIRRRRRAASGVAALAVLGVIGVLTLPRQGKEDPRPLPIATPTVSPTDETRRPTSSQTPTGTPSESVSPSPSSTPSGTRTTSTTGTASRTTTAGDRGQAGTRTSSPTSTQRRTTRPRSTGTDPSDPSTWGRYGVFKPGDWLAVGVGQSGWTAGSGSDSGGNTGSWSYRAGDDVTITIAGNRCASGTADATDLVAIRKWEWDGPVTSGGADSWITQTATTWDDGAAQVRMHNLQSCWGERYVVTRSESLVLEVLPTGGNEDSADVRGVIRVGDTLLSILVTNVSGTSAQAEQIGRDLLSAAAGRLQDRGSH